jgi:PAS domain S-box-containing protein
VSFANGEPGRQPRRRRRANLEVQGEPPTEEIKRLRRCINDLVSVFALPAVWSGGDSSQIVRTLLDVLLGMLDLDLVYVRLKDPIHEAPVEMARLAHSRDLTAQPREIGEILDRCLGRDPQKWAGLARNPIGYDDISVLPLQLGLQGEIGVVVAGSRRADFPGPTETLLLSVAANQAVIGLQEARLLAEQKRLADLLDQRVAQRTRELTAANEELKREIAERKRVDEERKRSEVRKAAILDSALDCIVTIDHEGRIAEFNPAAERTFGYHRDEVVGKRLADVIVPPSLREKHRQGLARYLHTGESRVLGRRVEMTAIRSDGMEFPVELAITRIPLEGPPSFTVYLRDITERKQSEESFRTIVETTPECVKVIARDGTLLRVNSAGLTIAGAESADLVVGRSFYDFLAPEDRDRYREFNERICSGQKGSLEFDIIDWRGERRQMETHAAPMHHIDGSIVQLGVARDITARKQAERKLQESELNLRQMTETIPEMLWSATPEGEIDYCNTRVLNYTGFSPEEVMGHGLTKLLHPDDVDQAARAWMSCVRSGAPYCVEVRTFHAADRTYRWCITSAVPLLDEQGHVLKWHGTVVDMHDWKRAQEELHNMRAELAHMTRVMTMGELTSSIAHEINQPLASIMTNGETSLRWLTRPKPDVEKVQELTKRVVADARRASEIIDRIRAMVSRRAPQQMEVSLHDVIEESMVFLRHEFKSRGISVSLDLAPELPEIVGDRSQLQQVVLNLAINAVQAMAQSESARRRIFIRTMLSAPERVCCSIEDSGPGIDAADLPHLFERFFTTKETGMGMGLPISQSIIEAHGGNIRADNNSTLGGARFSFTLPANGAR